jgi:putative membrane protein
MKTAPLHLLVERRPISALSLTKENRMRLLITWIINAAALFALPFLMTSIKIDSLLTALVAALILGLINTLIRPILVLLTLPVTFLTLGLFIFVINALLFWLTANLVDGFQVAGFWSAFGGAILYSIISWVLSSLLLDNK